MLLSKLEVVITKKKKQAWWPTFWGGVQTHLKACGVKGSGLSPQALPRVRKIKIQGKCQIPFFKILKKKILWHCASAKEISFEWSHHRNSSTNLEVKTVLCIFTLRVKRVKHCFLRLQVNLYYNIVCMLVLPNSY